MCMSKPKKSSNLVVLQASTNHAPGEPWLYQVVKMASVREKSDIHFLNAMEHEMDLNKEQWANLCKFCSDQS